MNEPGSLSQNSPSSGVQPSGAAPSEFPPSVLAARLLERSSRQLTLAIGHSIALVAEDLERAGEKARDGDLRRQLFAAAATLKVEQSTRAMRAPVALANARATSPLEVSLALLDAHDQELHIAAIEISKKVVEAIDSSHAGTSLSYDAFKDRSSLLFQTNSVETANPVGGTMLGHAACSVFRGLTHELGTDALLRQILVARLTPAVVDVVSQSHREMVTHQILPQWQARAVSSEQTPQATAPKVDSKTEDPKTNSSSPILERAVLADLQAAKTGEKLGQAPLANLPNPAENLAWLPTLQPVVDIERDAVAFAHSVNVVPYSRESRRYYFGNARKRLADSGLPKGQLAAVDVVSALFDYVVDDKRLPESAKPLFWRLQQPSLALTLLDSAYLADEPRSLRRLIENFGAIVTAFPDDMSRGSELFRRLETVIRAVEIVASSLQTRSAVMSRQVDLEFGKAASSITQLIDKVVRERQALELTPDRRNRRDFGRRPTRAQEVSVTDKLQKLINDRIGQHDVPDSAREFITQVWMRHLRTAVLRDGEDSQQYKVSLQVVDDLLWSLDNTKRSKTKLATRIPPLIRLLTQGMREIGAKDDEYKPFFDEIFLMHLRKMQSTPQQNSSFVDTEKPRQASPTISVPRPEATPSNIPIMNDQVVPTGYAEPRLGGEISQEIANSPIKLPPELLEQAGILRKPETRRRQSGPLSVDPPPVPTLRETVATPEPQTIPMATPEPTLHTLPNPVEPEATIQEYAIPAQDQGGEDSSEQVRLLDVLNRLDLSDYNPQFVRQAKAAKVLCADLVVGDWMELVARDGTSHPAKIAWINHRRSVVLLVRSPDRKAQSLRMADIEQRVGEKRIFLLRVSA
jgi:Protein of unknown function (DUF1631)